MSVRIDKAITFGSFETGGWTFDVTTNVWVVGNEEECVVIDAPDPVEEILVVVGTRAVTAIICTQAHATHAGGAPALREKTSAPLLVHPDAREAWTLTHPAEHWDADLADGQRLHIGGTSLRVLHMTGHSPGSVALHAPDLGVVFTGDALLHRGRRASRHSIAPPGTNRQPIPEQLLALADETIVKAGHGRCTTIGVERARRTPTVLLP